MTQTALPDDLARLLTEAQGLAEIQRLDEAVAVLARSPHPECDYRRAGLLMLLKRWSEAESAYRRVLAVAPGHGEARLALATALIELGRPVEALPLIEPVAKARPGLGRVAYLLGVALDEAGRPAEAAPHLRAARDSLIRSAEARGLVPWEIYLQVSRRCNLRCAMCGHEIWQSNSGFMEEPVFERVLAEAEANGIDSLHILSGQGEPLLHPRIFEMLEQAAARGFKVGIVTNGTPLTPDRIQRLAGIGLAYIQFSFAGWDKPSYEGVYVGAKFERTLANLKAMNEALPPGAPTAFAVKAVAAGDWKATLERTKAFLSAEGIERVFTITANNFGGAVQCGTFHEKHGVWSLKAIEHQRRMPCRVLLKAVGVFCDGTVTACACYDSNADLRIGHIMEQPLADIRRGEPFRRILEAFRAGDVADIPMCGKCDDPFG